MGTPSSLPLISHSACSTPLRAHSVTSWPVPEGLLVERIPNVFDLKRVLADEEILYRLERGDDLFVVALYAALADARQPGIGVELDEEPIAVLALCFEDLHVGNFQDVSPGGSRFPNRFPATSTNYGLGRAGVSRPTIQRRPRNVSIQEPSAVPANRFGKPFAKPFPPREPQQRASIVALVLPSVSIASKGRRVGAPQKRSARNETFYLEHHITPQEPINQDFRFGSSDGTSLHPHPAKRNHFSTRKRRRLRRDRSSPLLAPHGG